MDSKQKMFFILSIIISIGGFVTEANADIPTYKCKEPSGYNCTLDNIHLNKTHFRFNIQSDSPLEVGRVNVYNSVIPVLSSDICSKFRDVQTLFLQDLKIEDILYGAFSSCKKVKSVLLNGNRLLKLHHSTFNNNKEIEILELQYNQIRLIATDEEWHDLPKLKVLLLHKNYVKEFNSMLFRNSESLEVLNLASNDLLDINEMDLLERFKHLNSVAYNDNQLSCHRVARINEAFENAGVEISRMDYNNSRFYDLDLEVYQNITCLRDTVWLHAKERSDKTY